MAKAPRPWIVSENDPLQKLDDNLWCVRGKLPKAPIDRRMAIIKRADGTLAFHNAIPVDDATLAEITAWGKPAILIVPSGFHRMDVHAFREKLGLKVYGPATARKRIESKVPMDGTYDDFPGDAVLSLERLEGAKEEVAFRVKSGERSALVFCDAMMNIPKGQGGLIVRMLRSSGGPKCTPLFRMIGMKDKKALRADFARLAKLAGLKHLVPSHGEIVSDDAAGTLEKISTAF
jgi:hypothetical protein